jgi:site-specific recombinase XerD
VPGGSRHVGAHTRGVPKKSEAQFAIPHARAPQKLPQILAREEIEALFQRTVNPKHRAILMVAYGAGLRLNEICHLKV